MNAYSCTLSFSKSESKSNYICLISLFLFCLKLAYCWLGDISLSKQMQMFCSLASRYLAIQQSSISPFWLTHVNYYDSWLSTIQTLKGPIIHYCSFVNVCQYISNQDLSKTMQDVHFLENTFLLSGFFGKFFLQELCRSCWFVTEDFCDPIE